MTVDIPVYVISLRKRNPRRAALFERLGNMSFRAEVVDAVDGRQGLDPSWDTEYCRRDQVRRFGRELIDTEIACALSHREVYRRFLETPAEWALVIEDDAIFDQRLEAFVANGGYRIAPIVLLHHKRAYVHGDSYSLPGTGSVARKLVSQASGAQCYSLNREIAKAMIRAQSPVYCPADFPIELPRYGCMVAVPRICDHPDNATSPTQIGWAPGRRTLRCRIRRLISPGFIGRMWRKHLGRLKGVKVSGWG